MKFCTKSQLVKEKPKKSIFQKMKDISTHSAKKILATAGLLFLISTFSLNISHAQENTAKKQEYLLKDTFCYQKDSEKKPFELTYSYDEMVINLNDLKKIKMTSYYKYNIDFGSQINFEKNLSFFCSQNGDVLWLGEKTIYLFKIQMKNEKEYNLNLISTQSHTQLNEYHIQGGTIIASDIYYLGSDPFNTPIATITKKGFFHVEKISKDPTKKEQFQLNLAASEWELDWPEESKIKEIKVKILSPNEFLVVPIGTIDSLIKRAYLILWPDGKHYANGVNADVFYSEMKNIDKSCRTIIGATDIVYNESEGGWHTIISYLTEEGEIKEHSLKLLTKEDVKQYLK